MRFYGIPSEDRAMEILEKIKEGVWVFVDNDKKERMELDANAIRERLLEVINEVKSWKGSNKHVPTYTTFVFVHEPQNPKAFKIYDLSSLGCSTSLFPPRWLAYLKELGDKMV